MSRTHRVKRVLLEVGTPDPGRSRAAGEAHALLARAARGVPALIESVCDEIDVPAHPQRFDRIEVDLGRLGALADVDFERQLLLRLEQALRGALRGAARAIDPADAHVELLARFARSGVLPWWAERRAGDSVGASVRALAEQSPARLIELVRELAAEPGAVERELRRLALALDDAQLARVCALLAPHGPWPEGWLSRALARLAAADLRRRSVAEPAPGGRRASLWSCALAAAARAPGARRTPSDLLHDIALAYAGSQGFEVREVLAALATEARAAEVDAPSRRTLPPGVAEAERGGIPRHDGEQARADSRAPAGPGRADDADEPAASEPADVGDAAPPDGLDASRDARVESHPWSATAARSAGTTLSRDVIPAPATDAFSPATRRPPALATSGRETPRAPRLPIDPGPGLRDSRGDVRAEPSSPVRSEHAARTSATSDEGEEIYVDNSGLVILWPFLARFFANLELASGPAFVDVAAARRGAALLEYAATGAVDVREPSLVLNKVLCGIELGDVFELDAPLRPHELEEVETLLRAVVERAPILRSMSTQGLRGTFLLRAGRLAAGHGRWLLRVERQTYDVVLDRFPWSMSWVKLPWMSAPLQVEW